MSLRTTIRYSLCISVILFTAACTASDSPSGPDEPEDPVPVFSFSKNADTQFPSASIRGLDASDINGDGMTDLVAVQGDDAVLGILEGDTGTSFTTVMDTIDVRNPCCYSKIALNDLDKDGFPDAIVTDASTSGGLDILINQQNGRFSYKETIELKTLSAVREIVQADFSGDGLPDIAINRHFGQTSLFYNNGEGGLSEEIEIVTPDNGMYTYMGITAGDFDNSGTTDLAHVSEDGIFISFFGPDSANPVQNRIELQIESFSRNIEAGDMNNDGYTDILTSHSILFNTGNGRDYDKVELSSGEDPAAVALADMDRDGHTDIIIADRIERKLYLLRNDGEGSFDVDQTLELEENLTTGGATPVPYDLVIKDYNADGMPDIAAGSFYTGSVFVFINESDVEMVN